MTDNQEVALMAAYLTSDLSISGQWVMFKFHEVCTGCYGDESLTRKGRGYDLPSTNDDLRWLQHLSAGNNRHAPVGSYEYFRIVSEKQITDYPVRAPRRL